MTEHTALPGLVDIGANLASGHFDHDLDAVLERAWAAGVDRIVVTGSSADSNGGALALAQRYPGRLWSTAGLHPHHASDWTPELASRMRDWLAAPQVVAAGECGLDYFRDLSPRAAQRQAFLAQLDLAVASGKPVFLHQREAHADFLPILREYRPQLRAAVVHCFTDTREALEDYLELDCHIGITGWICDERRGSHLLGFMHDIPATRLMIETDAPYLLPRTAPKSWRRSGRNEPALLPHVLQRLAEARGETPESLAALTRATSLGFFDLRD